MEPSLAAAKVMSALKISAAPSLGRTSEDMVTAAALGLTSPLGLAGAPPAAAAQPSKIEDFQPPLDFMLDPLVEEDAVDTGAGA